MTDTLARMRQLSGSTAQWAANDLVLGAGELAAETLANGGARLKLGVGTTPYSQLPYVGDVAYVEDYGAVADWNAATGTGTDLAPAWDKAVAALPSAGGVLRLRPGSYVSRRQLVLPWPGHYLVEGAGGSEASNNFGATEIIKPAALSGPLISVRGPFSLLRNFVVRGVSGNVGDGIQIAAHSVKLEHVGAFLMGQDGIRVGGDPDLPTRYSNCNGWHLAACVSANNGRYGYYIHDDSASISVDVNAGLMQNCVAQSNVNGYRMGAARLNTVVGGDFEGNSSYGAYFTDPKCGYNAVFGGDYERNPGSPGTPQIYIDTGVVSIGLFWLTTCFDTEVIDNGTRTRMDLPLTSGAGAISKGIGKMIMGNPAGANDFITGGVGSYIRMIYGGDTISDANAHVLVSSLGTFIGKVGGAVGFYGATPVARSTGWGTPTGPVKLINFPGATATLPQCSAAIAQIIADLKSLGLYGA
jgi:hypothetical protein